MAKILLIIFAIIVGFIVATGWVLGAIRRMLGIPARKSGGFKFHTNFNNFAGRRPGRGAQSNNSDDVIYKNDEVVVLKGDGSNNASSAKASPGNNEPIHNLGEGDIRDVDYTDKG